MSFEEAIARLEAIVQELESGEGELEASLRLFEEGVTLAKQCQKLLDVAEGRIEELLAQPEGVKAPQEGELFAGEDGV